MTVAIPLSDFAPMLGWKDPTPLLMLYGSFDESGEHAPHLTRLTIGGLLAPYSAWKPITEAWDAALGERVFHMVDFEAYRGVFADLTKREHERLLDQLLEPFNGIQGEWIAASIPAELPSRRAFKTTSGACLARLISGAATKGILRWRDDMHLDFAWHAEFSAERIGVMADEIAKHVPQIVRISATDPRYSRAHQVADMLAYEIRCVAKEPTRARYPLKRLNACGIGYHVDIR